MSTSKQRVRVRVNGTEYDSEAEPRQSLADFLRDELGLDGTHLGCEHGVCGACTVLLDGASVRSCILFAVQTDGREVATVEALSSPTGPLHPLQAAFSQQHGLQCGFCTPGFLMVAFELLMSQRDMTEQDVRSALGGNLCRCTGYQGIVEAVMSADRNWER